jgi:hypothetical protein
MFPDYVLYQLHGNRHSGRRSSRRDVIQWRFSLDIHIVSLQFLTRAIGSDGDGMLQKEVLLSVSHLIIVDGLYLMSRHCLDSLRSCRNRQVSMPLYSSFH